MGSRVRVPPRSPCSPTKPALSEVLIWSICTGGWQDLCSGWQTPVPELFRHCGGPVLGGPGGGGYLVDLPPLRNEFAPLGRRQARGWVAGRLGVDRWSVLVPGQNPAARYGSLGPIDAVDPVVKARAGSGSNAASGNGDGQMCLAGVWPRRRDPRIVIANLGRFVVRHIGKTGSVAHGASQKGFVFLSCHPPNFRVRCFTTPPDRSIHYLSRGMARVSVRRARKTSGAAKEEGPMATFWIYVDTRYHPGHPDHLKVFANGSAAAYLMQAHVGLLQPIYQRFLLGIDLCGKRRSDSFVEHQQLLDSH
jgi:hypothetical protein